MLFSNFVSLCSGAGNKEEEEAEDMLVSLGVLMKVDGLFKWSCPLVRVAMMLDLVNEVVVDLPPSIKIQASKCFQNGVLHLEELLFIATTYISLSVLKDKLVYNSASRAPSEAFYHFELYCILHWLLRDLSTGLHILPEVGVTISCGKKRKYLDILISNGDKYAIEIAANNTKADLDEHVHRTHTVYVKQFGTKAAVVVNFTTCEDHVKNFSDADDLPVINFLVDVLGNSVIMHTKSNKTLGRLLCCCFSCLFLFVCIPSSCSIFCRS